jgi:hypothetical protein
MPDEQLAMNRCYWRSRRGLLELESAVAAVRASAIRIVVGAQRRALRYQMRGSADLGPGCAITLCRIRRTCSGDRLIRAFNANRGVD